MMIPAFRILPGLAGCMAAAGLAACDQVKPFECDQEVRRCVRTQSGDVERVGGPPEQFEISLSNVCQYEVDVKLCFQVPNTGPDCREFTLRPTQVRQERVDLDSFTGRSRLHVRRSDEAKACRFPLTPDVTFEEETE